MRFDYDKSLSRSDALAGLLAAWPLTRQTETVFLRDALGRVLGEDVYAHGSLPVYRSSRRDGIAVRSSDFAHGLPDTRVWVRGIDYAQADTGDDFPDEFDAVIAVEDVGYDESGALILHVDPREVCPGAAVNASGSIVESGSLVVPAYTRLTPELVAALAVADVIQVRVVRKPVVAFLPTGSELVSPGSFPVRGQNIEANSLLVEGMVLEWGAEPWRYPVVRDESSVIEQALDRALEAADIVLINGGSSRGEEDHNATILERRGSYFRHGVRAVPGRPVGMALIDGKPVINVPGPVLAAFLSMDWLVRGLVANALGVPAQKKVAVKAILTVDIDKPVAFEKLTRVSLQCDGAGGYRCAPLSTGMGVPQQLFLSDGMLVLPIGSTGASAGSEVDIDLLKPLEAIGIHPGG